MDHIVKGKHDQSFTSMARHTSSATNLDLGCEGMKHVQQLISEIWALCEMDFSEHIGFEQCCLALDRAPGASTDRWGVHPGTREGI